MSDGRDGQDREWMLRMPAQLPAEEAALRDDRPAEPVPSAEPPAVEPARAVEPAAAAPPTPAEPTVGMGHPDTRRRRTLAAWALVLAIAGLAVSFFVGWGLPISLFAIVIASIALRRPSTARVVAGWALALGIVSFVFGAGWLLYTAFRSGLFA